MSGTCDVHVKGHWRELKPRKKKRAPAAPKKGQTYYVAESSTGATCPHHHTTRSGARRCANDLGRKARMAHARLTRKQAKATRVVKWDVDSRTA